MGANNRQFTLLLVDDNPTNLLLLVKIIELDLPEVGVLTAATALEGLKLAECEHIDGAFIDVQMPGMDGLEMCRRLRKMPQTATIPLVLMTAHIASPEMRAEGLEVGAHDFISQPISNVEMLARIKVMLRLCESEQRSNEVQQQLVEHTDRLRWIRGLLFSGDGPLAEIDQQLLRKLVDELPDPAKIDEKQFFEKVVTEFPLPWRRTLLKLALLDHVPVALAEKLSEIADITALFDYLNRHQLSLNQTLDGEECLFFNPPVRDLLRQKAKQLLSEKEQQQVGLIAADWYHQQKGYTAALGCLISTAQYPAVSQLLNQLGFSLLEKRYRATVFALINTIPEEVLTDCGWMALFRGIYFLQEQRSRSDYWLSLAFRNFSAAADRRGQLLTLTQMVRQSVYLEASFERWRKFLPLYRELSHELSDSLSSVERLKVAYALGLAELIFCHGFQMVESFLPGALAEAQQAQLVEQQLELSLLRGLTALQQGRYLVAKAALEQALTCSLEVGCMLENDVLQAACCGVIHAGGDLAGFQKQRQMLSAGCQHGRQPLSIMKPLMSYYAAGLFLAKGESQRTFEILEIALLDGHAAGAHLQSRLLQLRGWTRALSGDERGALDDLNMGLRLREHSGGVYFRLESLLYAGATSFTLGHYHQAAEYFVEALEGSLGTKEERFRPGLHAWMAVSQLKLGKIEAAIVQVDAFVEQLRRHRVSFFWGLTPELLEELLPLIRGREGLSLFQTLLEEHLTATLTPDSRVIPLLKVHCLGRFELKLEDTLFDMSQVGQASRSILSLLVASPNHSVSSELIMGVLWPDSPPHKARNNFDTAHSRLRKALEKSFGKRVRKDYLVLEKGMVSLRHVIIDSSNFDETMERVRYHLQREHYWQAEHALWKMDRIWGGEFLSGYDLNGDLSLQRDRLTLLRLEQLGLLAQLLQQRGRSDDAIEILQRGLLLDPTHDSMVRKLLALYRQRHDNHAAEALLEQYRSALRDSDYAAEEIDELIDVLGS
jgi:DNA-binding response OmpR family regulator